jgi:all-trans-retinol 13,14-reductase
VPERFRARAVGARTPFRDLYLTGQDASTAGVAGAMIGGLITASVVLLRKLPAVASRPGAPASGAPAEQDTAARRQVA